MYTLPYIRKINLSTVKHGGDNIMLGVASLTNALLTQSLNFSRQPPLGRALVVPYPFHFLKEWIIAALWDIQSLGYFFI